MAYEVVMPRLGWNMEVGALSAWRKHDGDRVAAGDLLFDVESEKAVQEIEALESGVLYIPPECPPVGQMVPVGTLLAYLLQAGEAKPSGAAQPGASSASTAAQPAAGSLSALDPAAGAVRPGRKPKPISPRALRAAKSLGVEWTRLQGSGSTGRIIERDVRAAAAAMTARPPEPAPVPAVFQASPLARRLAEEMGVDLAQLAAVLGRRVERADVESAIRTALHAPAPVSAPPPAPAADLGRTVQPVSAVRRLTAQRLSASAHTAAPVTLTTEADLTELVRLRRQLKEDGSAQVPSYTDIFICISAQALLEHPQLNAHFEGDTIVQPGVVQVGVAVDTERGLLVPVVPDAQHKSLRQVAAESAALIAKARAGRLDPAEMSGGTFTITNLGMFDIDAFTPIVNLPECAILGLGRITPKQVVQDPDAVLRSGAETAVVAVRFMAFLSLTFDHRLVDGGPAARFLQRVKQLAEKPYLWLVK